MAWTNAYVQAENKLGTPHGYKGSRPYPGGQRVGVNPVINNGPFANQANAQVVPLALYDASVSNNRSVLTTVDIKTPSSRLTTCIQLMLDRNDQISEIPPAQGAVPLVATLYALGVNPLTGAQSVMQALASYNPPAMFQIDPGYRSTRLVLPLDYRNFFFSEGVFQKGTLKLIATWEPNCEMSQDELNRLQAACSVSNPGMVSL